MTPSYLVRLLLLSSASFFLVQIVLEALIAFLAPGAIRRARTMRPQRAAGFLLALRLLPSALSAVVVAALCVPSYLRFEPGAAEEEVGFLCLTAGILGVAVCALAIYRSVVALVRSSRYLRSCAAFESQVAGESVWIVQRSACVALAGILNPRVLISEGALRLLSADQLRIALRHEQAHRASRDNLKRLLMLLAPSIFPNSRLLQQEWAKCAEWAADDQATQGDAVQSATLAEALVSIARLQAGVRMPALIASLVAADEDLSLRIDRLLESPVYGRHSRTGAIALAALALLIGAIALNPPALRAVHQLLEHLLG
ncbi:MAG TPA: M56 family metallopeptidase [Bryobacteraceae bacterium]|jgi:Zn-dependent protease with chaperone function|nr:M56 family metallopeptidase [Bryobacteraceae bacterium]